MGSLCSPPRKTLTLEPGASHAPTFSKKTTHLLCPSRQGPKAEKALEWGIPVVDMIWLGSLVVSTTNSPMTEEGVSPLPLRSEGGEEEVVRSEPTLEPVLQRALFYLLPSILRLKPSKQPLPKILEGRSRTHTKRSHLPTTVFCLSSSSTRTTSWRVLHPRRTGPLSQSQPYARMRRVAHWTSPRRRRMLRTGNRCRLRGRHRRWC